MNKKELEKIEELESKYLEKYFHFLKSVEDEMFEGFKTKDKIIKDWQKFWNPKRSEFDVGAERIVYSLFNGKMIGNPNSCPVGSDLFFETKDAFIHIDLKTVKASLDKKTNNIGDYLKNIFVGNNQNSYNGKIDVGGIEKEYKNANLPKFYSINSGKKICLTYFITILYDVINFDILNINLLSMPNGSLYEVYGKDILNAGKVQTALKTKEERKKISQTIRYNWSKNIDYKLLENKKRIKVIYFNKNMDKEFKKKLKLIEKIYKNQR